MEHRDPRRPKVDQWLPFGGPQQGIRGHMEPYREISGQQFVCCVAFWDIDQLLIV